MIRFYACGRLCEKSASHHQSQIAIADDFPVEHSGVPFNALTIRADSPFPISISNFTIGGWLLPLRK